MFLKRIKKYIERENLKKNALSPRKESLNLKFSIPRNCEIYIIAYDISDDKRRLKIFEELKKIGIHTQYSVFEVVTTSRKIKIIKNIFKKYLNPKEDNLIICKVNKNGYIYLNKRYKDIIFII